jgi:outer membrane receptor protein involved in Fe transport
MSLVTRLWIVSQGLVVSGVGLAVHAQDSATTGAPVPEPAAPVVALEPMVVFSDRVALQEPVGTFAAPVSALRYEPQVDVQGRGFAEAQADVSIRGGTFENTGFSLGALPIYDPQTGHYSAELPVSPYLLGAPEIRTGAEQAATGFNATSGGVVYGWRPIRTGGAVSVGAGGDDLARGEIYSGVVSDKTIGGFTLGADVAVASAQGDGTRAWTDPISTIPAASLRARESDFDFERVNGRVQLANAVSQTDFFAGYQAKDFAWPNLYAARLPSTPLRYEREQLQTKLFVVNHRTTLGTEGDYVQAGAYYRGNRDHYTIPVLGADLRHQTLVRGAALDGRQSVMAGTAFRYSAGVAEDDLDSTSLTAGRFMSRSQVYGSLAAEQTVALAETRDLVLSAGARHDDSNRDGSETSPLASVELRQTEGALRRVYLSYAESTQLPTYQALNASSTAGLFRGDADLPRATAANVEIGTELVMASWTVQTAVFFRQDDRLLDYVFDPVDTAVPQSSRFARAVDVDTVGLEVFAKRGWTAFDLFVGYTFLDKRDDYTNPDVASFYALNYAEHRLTLGGIARLGGGFELRMDNELRRQAANSVRQDGRDNVDSALGLYYRVPGLDGLVLNAQVENLWDNSFQEVPLVPSSGRAWSVGASYVW